MQEVNVYLYEFHNADGTVTRSPEAGQQEIIDSNARYKVIVCGRRWGKDQPLTTKILTTKGWKTIGTVRVGDKVFGPDGKPVMVVRLSETYRGRDCYRVTFSDGSVVEASGTHNWLVESRSFRKNIARTRSTKIGMSLLTTEEMYDTYILQRKDGGIEHNYSIPVTEPLVFSRKSLLIDPYLLGYWLGNGASKNSEITIGDNDSQEIVGYIEEKGYEVKKLKSPLRWSVYNGDRTIMNELRKLGVSKDKHIPEQYLMSSVSDRFELLRGLMDSDGYIEENGNLEYCSKSNRLAEGVKQLVIGLGIKCTLTESDAKLYGRVVSKRYRLSFTTDKEVFKLRRKANRINKNTKADIKRRFVVRVEKIDSVPTKCITVDSESGLYLAGESLIATHNSTLGINEALKKAQSKDNATVWYIAPTYGQAKTIAWRFLISRLQLFPKSYQNRLRIQENQLQITFPNGSVLALKGVDNPDSLRGSGLDYVVLDEYAMDNYQRYPVWREIIRPALADRGGGALFISTPKGFNGFYDLYAYADSGVDPDWEAWRMPTSSCRHVSKKELDAAKRELGEDLYSQEFEAEFKKRSGLVYKEFDRDVHLVGAMNPMDVPRDWYLEIGVDFGAGHPTAAVYVMFNNITDTAYVVDEFYQAEGIISENAEQMMAKERRWMKKAYIRWGDCQGKQEIIEYNKAGFVLAPTPKGSGDSNTLSVEPGIQEIKSRLRVDPVDKVPRLYICKNCVNLIKEFENYRWKSSKRLRNTIEVDEEIIMENRMADAPEKRWDDCLDALRYVLQYHRRHDEDVIKSNYSFRPRNALTGI